MSRNVDQQKKAELAKRSQMSAADKLAEYDSTMGSKGRLKALPTGLSCSASVSKKILVGMNVFFLVCSVVILAIGAYALNADNPIYKESSLPTGIMVLGGFVLVMSFLGCFGALQENRVLLLLYAILLCCAILCQIILAGIVLGSSSTVEKALEDAWKSASNATREEVQKDFDCCGFRNPGDYNSTCPGGSQACLPKVKNDITKRMDALGGVGIFFAITEIFGVIFAFVLRSGIQGSFAFQ